jgi:hypothetical protein
MHLRSPIFLLVLALSIPLIVGSPSPASGDSIRFQAENFTMSGDGGGYAPQSVPCSGASNGLGVAGVDTPGDWIAWRYQFTTRTCFVDSLRSQGQSGFARNFVVRYTPDAPVITAGADTTMSVAGAGIG